MRKILFSVASIAAISLSVPVSAQSNLDGRVGKLESEMRAVQRKVFPGGAGQYLQPEISAPQTPAGPGPGVPATSAVADLSARVTSLEQQITTMTGQIEQLQYRQRQLEESFAIYKKTTDAKLAPAADPAPIAGSPQAGGEGAPPPVRPTATRPAAATPAPADVAGVEKPSTGDAPEDEYLYGYRLWAAKAYPQAEVQLKKVATTWPKHRRASYAQNLLGRAYLDDGKPSLASMAFYESYKKFPDGERAPESLYYLAQALVTLKKPADACKVYGELTDVYSGKISAKMQADVVKGRAAAKCQ